MSDNPKDSQKPAPPSGSGADASGDANLPIQQFALKKIISEKDFLRQSLVFSLVVGVGCALIASGPIFIFMKPSYWQAKLPHLVVSYIGFGVLFGFLIHVLLQQVIVVMTNIFIDELRNNLGMDFSKLPKITTQGNETNFGFISGLFSYIVDVFRQILSISFKIESTSNEFENTSVKGSKIIRQLAVSVEKINVGTQKNYFDIRDVLNSLKSNLEISQEVAEYSLSSSKQTDTATELASKSRQQIQETVSVMVKIEESAKVSTQVIEKLNENSKQIEDILISISNIAEQTNLLALNAAIEAARAGEQGRGFAVVAEEIRKLALESAGSSNAIGKLINEILQNTESATEVMQNSSGIVRNGKAMVGAVSSSLEELVGLQKDLNGKVNKIVVMSQKQNGTSTDIYKQMEQIANFHDEVCKQIKEMVTIAMEKTIFVDQTAIYAKELKTLSDYFQNALVPFRIEAKRRQRAHVRCNCRVSAKFMVLEAPLDARLGETRKAAEEYRGVITNISAGGLVLEVSQTVLDAGKYVTLTFQLGSFMIRNLQGRVIRVIETLSQETKESLWDAPIAFLDISDEDAARIQAFVATTLKKSKEDLSVGGQQHADHDDGDSRSSGDSSSGD